MCDTTTRVGSVRSDTRYADGTLRKDANEDGAAPINPRKAGSRSKDLITLATNAFWWSRHLNCKLHRYTCLPPILVVIMVPLFRSQQDKQ